MKPPVLNKWNIHVAFTKDWARGDRGWNLFTLAIYKPTSIPEPGFVFRKPMYKGFMFKCAIWLPISKY